MITSVLLFCPASLGVVIVVAWTASTVPLSRTLRTKSCRVTVALVREDGDAGVPACLGARACRRPDTPNATTPARATADS